MAEDAEDTTFVVEVIVERHQFDIRPHLCRLGFLWRQALCFRRKPERRR
jgi:hypothetical protein